jgi:hypothetical protein
VSLTTSAQFSLVLRVRIDHRPGMLGRVATAIGHAGGTIGSIDLVAIDDRHTLRDMRMAAARGVAQVVPESDLRWDHITPSPFNPDVPAP